ncbi:MAG: hypothetical protein ACLSHC_11890 [Bilophila wadsworthia]
MRDVTSRRMEMSIVADDRSFLIEGRQLGLRVQRLLDGHLEIIGMSLAIRSVS